MARDDRAEEFTVILGFFIAISTILVLLRCYCKIFLVRNFAADDYFSVLTLASFLVFCTSALLGIQNGTGKRRYLIPDDKYPVGMKWWWVCEPVYVVSNFFLKLSIGIFLLRVAVERTHRMILWITLLTIEIYSVYFFFLFTFQCWPVQHFWEQFRGGTGTCIPSKVVVNSFYAYSALSCVSDWTFSIVPIFIVLKLQMSRRKKISVGIVLAFCALGSSATIVRFPYINGLNNIPDFLYATIDIAIWSVCETGIGLATSAAATLRPLMRQVFGDASSNESSVRKQSRRWKRTNPSRSGYLEQSSQGDHNDIQLTGRDAKYDHVHTITGGAASPSESTAELNSWEYNRNKMVPGTSAGSTGILRTVKITQL